MIESPLDLLLPKTLHVVTDALSLLPDIHWIEMCKPLFVYIVWLYWSTIITIARNILLLFISSNPIKYRRYQYQIYLYLGEQTELESSADPLKYIEVLMKVSSDDQERLY